MGTENRMLLESEGVSDFLLLYDKFFDNGSDKYGGICEGFFVSDMVDQ
jgi:hypothetical protein